MGNEKIEDKKSKCRNPASIPKADVFAMSVWHKLNSKLSELLQSEPLYDTNGMPVNFKRIKNPKTAFNYLAERYFGYLKFYIDANESFRRIIHPQKREIMRLNLDCVIIRLYELKQAMKDLEKTQFINLFDSACQNGCYPDQFILDLPFYFHKEMSDNLEFKQAMYSMVLNLDEDEDCRDIVQELEKLGTVTPKIQYSRHNICQTPKTNIHHKTGSFTGFIHSKNIYYQPETKKKIIKLQGYWRIWLSRKKVENMRKQEDSFLDMTFNEDYLMRKDQIALDELGMANKYKKEFEKNYSKYNNEACNLANCLSACAVYRAWELKYSITQWLLEMRDILGEFPEYLEPDQDSIALLSSKPAEDVWDDLEDFFEMKATAEDKKGADDKKKKDKKKPVEDKKGEEGWSIPPSNAYGLLRKQVETYTNFWYHKNEARNTLQQHDHYLLTEDIKLEVDAAIRTQVDELIRFELIRLKQGIDNKKLPKETTKKEKPVKEKKKKGDKLGNRPPEELIAELISLEVMEIPRETSLKEFLCVPNLTKPEYFIHHETGELMLNAPSLWDVKNLVMELCVIPMISQKMHKALPLTKTLLLCGPLDTGKVHLIHAVCHKVGATLIDLTPEKLFGMFPTKDEQDYFMQLVMAVARHMAPTVIMMEDCELMFLKKKDPESTEKPHRWIPTFNSYFKKIEAGERIMVIGATSMPYLTNNQMLKMFEKVIYIPLPDYNNREYLWRSYVNAEGANINMLNKPEAMSVLAGLSYGWGCRDLFGAVNTTAVTKVEKTKYVTLKNFVVNLVQLSEPSYKEELELWLEWYNSLPQSKERIAVLKERLGMI